MPFKSTAQQGWMFANKPEMAHEWAAHTHNFGSLPEHVGDKKKKKSPKKEASTLVAPAIDDLLGSLAYRVAGIVMDRQRLGR